MAQYDPELLHHHKELEIRENFRLIKDSFAGRVQDLKLKFLSAARKKFRAKSEYSNELNQEIKFQEYLSNLKE